MIAETTLRRTAQPLLCMVASENTRTDISRRHHWFPRDVKESLSNDDGDGNKNGKKAVGLDWRNNNFARASRFFVIS